jgi:TM2 domain-containing membrane protein YozV
MRKQSIAFLLSFIPGLGHIYLGKVFRGIFYLLASAGPVILALLLILMSDNGDFIAVAFIGIFFYMISFIDFWIVFSKQNRSVEQSREDDQEVTRFYTIILSFVPGLGHFQLGLMNRGLSFMATFLGLAVMVFFVAILSKRSEFLVFLAILPVIWVYGFFDAMQQLNKKQRGEQLVDRTILEDFETRREDGKKSKAIATFLSIFPGAGHLYLGYQRRGIQLMAAFLFSIYILDILRLGIFLFFIPIIWFYSFFDGLQKASKYGDGPIDDTPIISYFVNHQRWIGIGLILLGLYYLTTNIVIPAISPMLHDVIDIDLTYWFDRYFQMVVVCILLIGGGLKLLMGSKRKDEEATK